MPEQKYLTRDQAQDVVDFAQGLWLAENYGVYSPWLSNELLKNLNNNPRIPSLDKIKEALRAYKESGENLQGYTEFMSNYDMVFKRTLYSYVNTLAFDLMITCTNAFTEADYQSTEYQEDKRRIYSFLDNFDYKKEFRQVVLECMLRETYFTWFRKTKWKNKGMKFALQIMPQDYCMLTGYWEKGLLYDLDMNYYLLPGVDLDGYDPAVRKMYDRIFSATPDPYHYRPSNQLNQRTGQFAYWSQTSPEDGAWCFKFVPNNFAQAPYLSPFLKDSMLNDEIAQLQYNKDAVSAYGILAGELRLFDSDKSEKSDQFAISPKTIGTYMGLAKNAFGKLIKTAALPVENSHFYQFTDNNTDMYKDQLSTSAGVGSGVSRVIYSSDRMSNAEIEAGIIDQYNTMKAMYSQFNNFMNFFANKLTKKYKFRFIFDGCSYEFERKNRLERLTKIADKGIVLGPSAWASVMGYAPQDFDRLLDEARWGDFKDKWQLMVNANTASVGSSKVGRPQKEDEELSESGQMNRDANSSL